MSKRARALILGVALAAMNLAGTTAIAHAHTSDDPASKRHRALGQLELLAAEDALASQEQPTIADHTRRPPTETQVGESWRHRQADSQEQTAADATLQRVLDRERFSIPNGTPAQAPAPVPAKPSGRPGWLVASVAVLVAALALSGGLAVLAAKRTRRRARLGHAA